jgi:phage gpG-like protein
MPTIEIDVTALEAAAQLLDPVAVREAAGAGFERGIAQMCAYIQQDKLSGQVLNQRSGNLSQAVGHPDVSTNGDNFTATVGGPFYGGVHEFGATINVNSAVNLPGIGWRYLKTVTLPARPWLYPSAQEQLPNIAEQMWQEVAQALPS